MPVSFAVTSHWPFRHGSEDRRSANRDERECSMTDALKTITYPVTDLADAKLDGTAIGLIQPA
jgi:hypothetical protein